MSEAAKPRWRWFRFRLRTMLVAVGLLCVLLGLVVYRAEKQRRVVIRLSELGAWVSYDFDPNDPGGARNPRWAFHLGLHDYISTATCVHFDKPLASDKDLAILQDLPNVRAVFLDKSAVSDKALVHLRGLEHLTMLGIGDQNATDEALAILSELKQLEQLYVGVAPSVSHVTNAGMVHLAKLANLKQLWLENSADISDEGMVHIEGLAKLRVLAVRGTLVTYAIAFWERKTPKCTVLYDRGQLPKIKTRTWMPGEV